MTGEGCIQGGARYSGGWAVVGQVEKEGGRRGSEPSAAPTELGGRLLGVVEGTDLVVETDGLFATEEGMLRTHRKRHTPVGGWQLWVGARHSGGTV